MDDDSIHRLEVLPTQNDHAASLMPTPSEKITTGLTWRAVLVGLLAAIALSVGEPYGNMILRGTYMALDFTAAGALFLFFLLTGIINTILRFIHPTFALRGEELLVVYAMMLIGSAICSMGLTEYWLPILSGVFYYATPENDWAGTIHPFLKQWMVPQGEEAIKYFYEGLPEGGSIPWDAWIIPLLFWAIFLLAFYFTSICIISILRKPWIEQERLIYPLVQTPLEMAKTTGGIVAPFFKSGVMWLGFALPFIFLSLNALNTYTRVISKIPLTTTLPIFRGTQAISFTLNFPIVGFAYLINLDVALSLWLFNLLVKVQKGVMGVLGWGSTEVLGRYSVIPPDVAHEAMGAVIVLVAFGLWTARGHLRDVVRRAFGCRTIDDSGEILSYRTAFWGMLGGMAVMGIWLWASGLPAMTVPLFIIVTFIVLIAVTRIVVESGVPAARAPMIPAGFMISGIGTSVIGTAGLIALGFSFVYAADIRTLVMTSVAHGLKLTEGERRRRWMLWALGAALLVSMGSSVWAVLTFAYTHGGINLNPWFFGDGARAPFNDFVMLRINNPSGPHIGGWLQTIAGGVFMAWLMMMRQRFVSWPIHPIGYPIAGLWLMDANWFSIFLAWLAKGIILKYGGARGFQRARPFFLGMILGQFTCAGVWLTIDHFTGMTDNILF